MRTAFVRRTVLSASAVSLALLVSACGGSSDSGTKSDAKASAPASASSAPAVKGKTDAELTPLLVTAADAPGFVVAPDAEAKLAAGDSDEITTDKPECKVLVQSQALQKIGTPTGTARTGVTAKAEEDPNATAEQKAQNALGVTATMVGLSSYDGTGAHDLIASIEAAGKACAGGFTATAEGDSTKYESVTAGTGAPVTYGDDDTASLVLTLDLEDGDKAVTYLTAVRTGSTVATFSSISLTGKPESPVTLVAAQSKKLG
ncbi:hypothetical protein M8Z33_16805 [Streptomyces sp. ZAF1911]|uniref:hypothetical protein n=1 Tax=Streptomyces sp. ZAF1911 TaxID=2944129 RepID=UPI00237A273D|nr:hypothetical protein [Streptomyces sp. ZAF1911]MDD9378286.1 hypothetical protein [Streptomyces sp. ZAF1911]